MSSVAAVDGLAQSVGFPKFPDEFGHFGTYGGRFVAETLMKPLEELEQAYRRYLNDPLFIAELDKDLRHYVGRPSPLYYAQRWSERLGGARIFLKREDLNHTGAHKINNTVGQALLAQRMGKSRIIAETGAGQHGVATATVAARMGMECVIGRETREQCLTQTGRLPDALIACVGGGSNAMGLFYPFIPETSVAFYGVEAAGEGIETGRHAASLCAGRAGVLHGNRTYLLED